MKNNIKKYKVLSYVGDIIILQSMSNKHNSNNHASRVSKPPLWFTTYMGEFEKKIMSRIDNLVVKNNLKE